MLVTRVSMISRQETSMDLDVTQEQLDLYSRGQSYIQDVFPHLKPNEREFIKTGMTIKEQEMIFGGPNDFQDDDDDGDYFENEEDYDEYYDNGPTGHGDDCYSDADPGL